MCQVCFWQCTLIGLIPSPPRSGPTPTTNHVSHSPRPDATISDILNFSVSRNICWLTLSCLAISSIVTVFPRVASRHVTSQRWFRDAPCLQREVLPNTVRLFPFTARTAPTWLDLTWLDLTWLDLTWLDLTWLDLTWLDLTWLDLTWLATGGSYLGIEIARALNPSPSRRLHGRWLYRGKLPTCEGGEGREL